MNRFLKIIFFTPLIFGLGCSQKVYIPITEAGVTYDKSTRTVNDQVLKYGKHKIDIKTGLIIYEVIEKQEEFSLQFLFKDGSKGQIDFSVRFAPKADSLPSIYKSYRTDYIKLFVRPEIRAMIRNLLGSYNSSEVNKDFIEDLILQKLISDNPLSDLIDIKALLIRNLEFERLVEKAKQAGLDKPYSDLKSSDKDIRLQAISDLINSGSKTGYEIILEHWSKETDSDVKEFILKQLTDK